MTSLGDRFFAKVVAGTGNCWIWTGSLSEKGYAQFRRSRTHTSQAHRWIYETLVGPIPEGLQIDHLCRVKRCVNPVHLEPVTCAENIRRDHLARGLDVSCKRGHVWREGSFKITSKGSRQCLECLPIVARQRRESTSGKSVL